MTALHGKARTAETYLAGLGASGALIGGAIVAFVMLVGVVSFNAWPEASGLFTFSGGQAEVGTGTAGSIEAGQPAAPAQGAASTAGIAGDDQIRSARRGAELKVTGGTRGGARPGAGSEPGDGGGIGRPGASDAPAPQPLDPGAPVGGARNFVSGTVSNLGTTVERNTQTLGETLDQATGTGLGTSVGDLGATANDALQVLADSTK